MKRPSGRRDFPDSVWSWLVWSLITMKRPSERKDFPDCASCRYARTGPWTICVQCACEQLPGIQDPCPICSQELYGKPCRNQLCQEPRENIHIDSISAIKPNKDPLNEIVRRYKYQSKHGWGRIFARLLFGHLEMNWSPDEIDIIIANPPNPMKDHTTRVIRIAAVIDFEKRWPFDSAGDPAITKNRETRRAAKQPLAVKKEAAKEHAGALVLEHPDRIEGKRVVVYDDICTTGYQLNEVARRLKCWGATKVYGIVLARHPWKACCKDTP